MGRHEEPIPPFIPAKNYHTVAELGKLVHGLKCDYCLVPAAISDFTVKKTAGKVPSRKGRVDITLTPAPKVLKAARARTKGVLVGFKAEYAVTGKELEAKAKDILREYDLDFVVANDMGEVKRDATRVILVGRKGIIAGFGGSKAEVADEIWSAILHGVKG